ncbi:MAG: GNAT family N-acetyltransferase [Acidimicrobiia bacterium]
MDPLVRICGMSDADELVRLRALEIADLLAERDGEPWWQIDGPPEGAVDLLALLSADTPAADALVALGSLDGVPVGFVAASIRPDRSGELLAVVSDLFVEPGARELGVGEVLMAFAVDWARSSGCVGIDASVLPGSREAKNFFERSGLKARRIVVHRSLIEPAATPADEHVAGSVGESS